MHNTHIGSKLILYGDIFVKETEKISTISIVNYLLA